MKRTFDANYHTHTTRCGHAIGTDEQYVLAAIDAGFKVLGFSDHIPFEGISNKKDRMDYDQLDDYFRSIEALKVNYAHQIDIKLGFEAEYYPAYHTYYETLLKRSDYLILGQHYQILNQIATMNTAAMAMFWSMRNRCALECVQVILRIWLTPIIS